MRKPASEGGSPCGGSSARAPAGGSDTSSPTAAPRQKLLHRRLTKLVSIGRILSATPVIYEPVLHAFGGTEGMDGAHQLFHDDSRHLLARLTAGRHHSKGNHHRELAVLLCAALIHAAGQDWYEQGDIWARVAAHREPASFPPRPARPDAPADERAPRRPLPAGCAPRRSPAAALP
ncbi:thiopeptide-type bacteriocin biosynthesis protein [Nonomuraea monospora]|uniref:thiopeptide-type bacteriocin biosynthesis protein n=1 Tax=Nonomuraea monospora TaxID=568818 RepID=UPI0031D9B751